MSKQSGEVTAQVKTKSAHLCSHIVMGRILVTLIFLSPGVSQTTLQTTQDRPLHQDETLTHMAYILSPLVSQKFDATTDATNDTT